MRGKPGSHEDPDQPYTARPNLQSVARADALWHDLAEDEDDDGGGHQADGAGGEVCQED